MNFPLDFGEFVGSRVEKPLVAIPQSRSAGWATFGDGEKMRTFAIAIGVLLGIASCGLRAQQVSTKPAAVASGLSPAETARAADEKAITELLSAFTKAFDAGDAVGAAATYAEDAIVVDESGGRIVGREAIREQLAASFAENPGATIEIGVDELQFIGSSTAIEVGNTRIRPAGGEAAELSRFTAFYLKQDGRWLQAAVRDETIESLTPHDRLKELEWLVGDWINESEDSVVSTTCRWSDDGNFLLRDFSVKMQGQPVLSGTQRIGWDPTRKQFKTWIFDSEGGFGEGYWTRDGDNWVIKADGVRQDGQHASVTSVITRLGKDRAHWRASDRTLGGLAVPGDDEFIIVRKPPEVGGEN